MTLERNIHMSTLDAFRYAGAHLVNALVLLITLGQFRTSAVHDCSLKMAQCAYKRDRKGF